MTLETFDDGVQHKTTLPKKGHNVVAALFLRLCIFVPGLCHRLNRTREGNKSKLVFTIAFGHKPTFGQKMTETIRDSSTARGAKYDEHHSRAEQSFDNGIGNQRAFGINTVKTIVVKLHFKRGQMVVK